MANGKKTRRPPVKKSGGRKKGLFFTLCLLGVFAACALGGYFYYVHQAAEPVKNGAEKIEKHTIEKTGAGVNVDFTERSKLVQQAVDSVLKDQGLSALNAKTAAKSVKRQSIEGEIRWAVREMSVTADEEKKQPLLRELEKVLGKIGAEIISAADDTYRGEKVQRLELGIKDTVEGDEITIIADRIYLRLNRTQPEKAAGAGKIALIIDDFGYQKGPIDAYRQIACPMTFAILPNHPYSEMAAKIGHADGRQMILHLPMEAMSDQAKEEAMTVHTDMSAQEIQATVRELTDSVPYIIGVNNHQGSRATSNRAVMKTVLRQLTQEGLFFVDSRTSASSLAYDTAKQMKVPTAENQLFIDNSSDIKLIKSHLNQAADIAAARGQVIVIGHARPNTARALQEMVPELEARGFTFVFVSSLLE